MTSGGDGLAMINSHSFADAVQQRLGELRKAAEQRSRTLKAESDEAARIQKVWEDLASFISRGWHLHVLNLIEQEAALLTNLKDDKAARSLLEETYRISKEQAPNILRQFPADLEVACRTAGLPLDRGSRHPRYTFRDGFFVLEVNEQKATARLSDYETRFDEFPADIGAATEAVQREDKRVFGRPFDGSRFLKKLRSQYLAIVRKENQADGATILIRRITRRLGKNEKGFRTDEFLVDLSRLVQHGPTEIDGARLDLQQTKDTNEGMLLHGLAGRGYVGFIVFRKV